MRLCLVCGDYGAHMHHTLPKSVWPQHRHNPIVLIPLCAVCHEAWHRAEGNVPWDMLPRDTRELIVFETTVAWRAIWYPERAEAALPF